MIKILTNNSVDHQLELEAVQFSAGLKVIGQAGS
jgi:hypothetical protein